MHAESASERPLLADIAYLVGGIAAFAPVSGLFCGRRDRELRWRSRLMFPRAYANALTGLQFSGLLRRELRW